MSTPFRVAALLLATLAASLGACAPVPVRDDPERSAEQHLAEARRWAARAARPDVGRGRGGAYARCASHAWPALSAAAASVASEAQAISSRCTDGLLGLLFRDPAGTHVHGLRRIDDVAIEATVRVRSIYADGPPRLMRARDVAVPPASRARYSRTGFGVPVAFVAPRCRDRPVCEHVPPEGVFRPATAWIEKGAGDRVMLVIEDPLAHGTIRVGARDIPLAFDTMGSYALGVSRTQLPRFAVSRLLGDEIGRRAGLYLLDDYDPGKRPVIMIHGLASTPLAWARLSAALWGEPDLRRAFQVWHVVYQTDAPLLVQRRRIEGYLDAAWQLLDPEHDDPARNGVVLVGHSLGGVNARLLSVDSGDALWSAAFVQPPESLRTAPEEREKIARIFRFRRYPGVTRAIFLAAPHRGSPSTDRWWGRLFRVLIGQGSPEIGSLRQIARDNPEAVRDEVRAAYQAGRLNSVATLHPMQPVRVATEALVPTDIPFHTIAGVLPGSEPPGDGVVPLSSAELPGASSTLVLPSDHSLYENDEAIDEILRILRDDLAHGDTRTSARQFSPATASPSPTAP